MSQLIAKLFGSNGERLSYRRLLVFVVAVGLATWLTLAGPLDGSQWVDVVKWVGGVYIGADGLEKVAGAFAVKSKTVSGEG